MRPPTPLPYAVILAFGALIMMLPGTACTRAAAPADTPDPTQDLTFAEDAGPQHAVFAGGCFWCTEAVFEELRGVSSVVSGYAGGKAETANYHAVSHGISEHAEVIKITYDPAQISYGRLLKIFFTVAHDPTQLNRQGPDRGRQYRSAVFYQSDAEKTVVQAYMQQLDDAKVYSAPIVTTLEPLEKFYPAENYHQDYVKLNPGEGYVQFNALPKVAKVRKHFPDAVKKE